MREKLGKCSLGGKLEAQRSHKPVYSNKESTSSHKIRWYREGLWESNVKLGFCVSLTPAGPPLNICGWPGAMVGQQSEELVEKTKSSVELLDPAVLVCNDV